MPVPAIQGLTLSYTSGITPPVAVLAVAGSGGVTDALTNFPQAGLTIECWIATSQSTAGAVLFSYDDQTSGTPTRLWMKAASALEIGFGGNSVATGLSIADGGWRHLAVTVAPASPTSLAVGVYVDGALVWLKRNAIARTADAWPAASATLRLGAGIAGEPGYSGQLSEFRLWSGVRTGAQIVTGMMARAATSAPGAIRVWLLDAAPPAPAVTSGATFSVGSPALQYRIGRTLTADWTSLGAGFTYALAITAGDNSWYAPVTGLTTTRYAVSGFAIDTAYTISVQGVQGADTGPAATAQAVTIELGEPVPTLTQPATGQLTLGWTAIDQASGYQVTLTPTGGSATASRQTGTSFDLSAAAFAAQSSTYGVAAQWNTVTGPPTLSAALPAAPALTLVYDQPAAPPGRLTATLTTSVATLPYLLAANQGSTPFATALLAAGTTGSSVAASPGQTFTATARALPPGTIGPLSPAATITAYDMPGPLITQLSADGAAHTLTATWTSPTGSWPTPSYVAELWSTGTTPALIARQTPTGVNCTFTDPVIVDTVTLEVRVRLAAGGSLGRWSAWGTLTVGGLPQVTGVQAGSDTAGTFTVGWTALTASGVSYVVRIYGNGIDYATAALTANPATISQSDSKVVCNQVYNVTVTAQKAGPIYGPSSAAVTVTACQQSPYPPGPNTPVSDPIDAASGAFTYANPDLVTPGVMPLVFMTFYNGAWSTPSENPLMPVSPLGNRWTHSYLTRIVADGSGTYAYIFWGDQNIERYAIPAGVIGAFTPAGTVLGSLLFRNADLTYTLTRADASRCTFNADGTLAARYDRYGNATTLAYQGGLLATVTDAGTGNHFTLAYAGGLLTTVTDQSGRSVRYTVTGGNLASLVDVCGHDRTFAYTGASLMESGVDGNGVTVFRNTYTGARVTKQQDARAIAAGQSYGTILAYQDTTLNGAAVVVASGQDRAGNAISLTSLKANGATIAQQTSLSAGQIEAIQRSYDAFNNLLSETHYIGPQAGYTAGAGVTTTCTYSGPHQTSAVRALDASAISAVSRGFDGNGNKLFEAYYEGPASGYAPGAGNKWTYTYYPSNALGTVTDPLGRTTTLTYAPGAIQGLVQSTVDSDGFTTAFTYQAGALHAVTNPLGEVTTYTNDTTGRPQQVTIANAAGQVQYTTVYTYRPDNQVLTATVFYAGQTQAQGFVTSYGYDNVGNLTSTTDPTGTRTGFAYNPNNFLSKITYAAVQAVNRYVELGYDNNDFLNARTLTSSASGARAITTGFTPDAIGRTLGLTDPNGNSYGYSDAMIVSGSAPCQSRATTTWPTLAGNTATYTDVTLYDPIGRPIAYTDRSRQTVTIAYTTRPGTPATTRQQVVTTTYPATAQGQAASTTVAIYDALDRPVSFTDQAGKVTSYAYGSTTAGTAKLTTVTITDPSHNVRIFAYDATGTLVQDQLGTGAAAALTRYSHDALGRILSADQGQGTPVATAYSYGYDAASACVSVTVGRPGATTGATVQYYDGAGQLVRQVAGSGRTTANTYTPWGSLATYTDGRANVFTYTADDAGRLQQTAVTGGKSVVYTLDDNGNRLTATAGTAVVTQTFDAWNRRLTRQGVEGATVGYAYWPTDQLETLTYPDRKTVAYAIDTLGRLASVTDWHTPGRVTRYGYTVTDRLQTIGYANGATATYAFNDGGQLTGITHQAGGLVLAQWQLQYDGYGRVSQAATIQPLPPALAAATHSFVYTVGNQIQTQDGAAAAYDADGDYLGTSSTAPALGYDPYGRVVSAALPNTASATYGYDPDGLRTNWTVGGVARGGVYDPAEFLAPAVERGDPVRALLGASLVGTVLGGDGGLPRYADGPASSMIAAADRLLEARDSTQAVQQRFVWGLGLIAQEDASGDYHAFHADPVGNLSVLTDAAGARSDAAVFGSFGELLAATGATATPFRFGGQLGVADDGIGLLYMRARSYLPAQYRFAQPDYLLGNPLAPQSFNAYAYAQGNPVQAGDPLGLDTWKWVVGGIGGGLVLVAIIGGAAWAAGGGGGAGATGGLGARFGRFGGNRGAGNRGNNGDRGGNRGNDGWNGSRGGDGRGAYRRRPWRDSPDSIELTEQNRGRPNNAYGQSDTLLREGESTNTSKWFKIE